MEIASEIDREENARYDRGSDCGTDCVAQIAVGVTEIFVEPFLCGRLEAPLPLCMAPACFPTLQDEGGPVTKKRKCEIYKNFVSSFQ